MEAQLEYGKQLSWFSYFSSDPRADREASEESALKRALGLRMMREAAESSQTVLGPTNRLTIRSLTEAGFAHGLWAHDWWRADKYGARKELAEAESMSRRAVEFAELAVRQGIKDAFPALQSARGWLSDFYSEFQHRVPESYALVRASTKDEERRLAGADASKPIPLRYAQNLKDLGRIAWAMGSGFRKSERPL